VALNVDWIAVSIPLAWTFRAVAPGGLSWRAAITGGFATGAFVSGFLQGFTLFLALPIDLGLPFGGLTAVGAVIAVLLWMWLLHAVVLYGYRATLTAVDLHRLDVAAAAA
jgi:membrane protein